MYIIENFFIFFNNLPLNVIVELGEQKHSNIFMIFMIFLHCGAIFSRNQYIP